MNFLSVICIFGIFYLQNSYLDARLCNTGTSELKSEKRARKYIFWLNWRLWFFGHSHDSWTMHIGLSTARQISEFLGMVVAPTNAQCQIFNEVFTTRALHYPFCKEVKETGTHVLLTCRISYSIWS